VPVHDAGGPPSVDLTNGSGSVGIRPGTATSGSGQDTAMPGDGAPAAGPVTLETLLGTAHPMPVREEVGVAAAAGPTSGRGADVEAAQALASLQGAQFDSSAGLG
jgi:hypothetical protein